MNGIQPEGFLWVIFFMWMFFAMIYRSLNIKLNSLDRKLEDLLEVFKKLLDRDDGV